MLKILFLDRYAVALSLLHRFSQIHRIPEKNSSNDQIVRAANRNA
jgi:hypothetical protein